MTKTINRSKILLYKKKLRKEILDKLRSQTKEQILKKSEVVKKRLFKTREFKKAKCVVFYVSMEGEIDTHAMIDESIRMGKVVGVPVLEKGKRNLIISQVTDRIKQLENGPYGINQPKAAEISPICCETIDLVLVPGIAFDEDGNRLGRGKGYYDRFLEGLAKDTRTFGLCFSFQVVEDIPKLPHDIPVSVLLSDS